MSTNVIFFVFACIISLAVGYNISEENEVSRIKRQILNPPPRTVGVLNAECTGNVQGAQIQGVCRPVGDCQIRGGILAGTCNPAGLCCVYERTCASTQFANAKLQYFVAPQTFQTQCGLTVNLLNTNICQIRLDFERFSIGQPTSPSLVQTNSSYQCNNDAFTISSTNANLGFVHLCGQNAGQHIYVPVNGQSSVFLNFQFSGDRSSIQPFIPDWRIRITQLECASTQPNRPPSANAQRDAARIAPPGCLQYYTQNQGTFESFNYNNGQGPYIGQTSYAICFQRGQGVCGVRHRPEQFSMNYNINNNVTVCRPDPVNSRGNQDYVHIPGGVVNNVTPREYFCNNDISASSTITSTVPGPQYVSVRTDNNAQPGRREWGFRFNYQMLNTGCF